MHELALRGADEDRLSARARQPARLVVDWFKTEVWRDQRAWKPWANLNRLQPRLRDLISSELEYRRGSREPSRRARPARLPAGVSI